MSMIILIYSICLVALVIGTYTDIKTREVPDWVNYSLIFTGFGIRLIYSVGLDDYNILLSGIIGFAIFLALAYLMFYSGQWGGGDSKMIMGLGALIGLDFLNLSLINTPVLISFLINILFVGAAYGIIWAVFISIAKRRVFWPELKKNLRDKRLRKIKILILISAVVLLVLAFLLKEPVLKLLLISLGLMIILTFYLYIYIKSIEKTCMIKDVTPDRLTEGDWIVKDIIVDKKRITGPKDLGIDKKQIQTLIQLYKKKKIKTVRIKEGIPFVPSFLIAFIITISYGNLIWLVF